MNIVLPLLIIASGITDEHVKFFNFSRLNKKRKLVLSVNENDKVLKSILVENPVDSFRHESDDVKIELMKQMIREEKVNLSMNDLSEYIINLIDLQEFNPTDFLATFTEQLMSRYDITLSSVSDVPDNVQETKPVELLPEIVPPKLKSISEYVVENVIPTLINTFDKDILGDYDTVVSNVKAVLLDVLHKNKAKIDVNLQLPIDKLENFYELVTTVTTVCSLKLQGLVAAKMMSQIDVTDHVPLESNTAKKIDDVKNVEPKLSVSAEIEKNEKKIEKPPVNKKNDEKKVMKSKSSDNALSSMPKLNNNTKKPSLVGGPPKLPSPMKAKVDPKLLKPENQVKDSPTVPVDNKYNLLLKQEDVVTMTEQKTMVQLPSRRKRSRTPKRVTPIASASSSVQSTSGDESDNNTDNEEIVKNVLGNIRLARSSRKQFQKDKKSTLSLGSNSEVTFNFDSNDFPMLVNSSLHLRDQIRDEILPDVVKEVYSNQLKRYEAKEISKEELENKINERSYQEQRMIASTTAAKYCMTTNYANRKILFNPLNDDSYVYTVDPKYNCEKSDCNGKHDMGYNSRFFIATKKPQSPDAPRLLANFTYGCPMTETAGVEGTRYIAIAIYAYAPRARDGTLEKESEFLIMNRQAALGFANQSAFTAIRIKGQMGRQPFLRTMQYYTDLSKSDTLQAELLESICINLHAFSPEESVKNADVIAKLLSDVSLDDLVTQWTEVNDSRHRFNYNLFKKPIVKSMNEEVMMLQKFFSITMQKLKASNPACNTKFGFDGTPGDFIKRYQNLVKLSSDSFKKVRTCLNNITIRTADGRVNMKRQLNILRMLDDNQGYQLPCGAIVTSYDELHLHPCVCGMDTIGYGNTDHGEDARRCLKCQTVYASHFAAELCKLKCNFRLASSLSN